jgi:hypothetical protein
MTAEEFLERAMDWSRHAIALREAYAETYGDNSSTHGHFNRFPISGGVCDHWPRQKKDNVAKALRKRHQMITDSLEAWKETGRRRVTWLRLKEKMMGSLSLAA